MISVVSVKSVVTRILSNGAEAKGDWYKLEAFKTAASKLGPYNLNGEVPCSLNAVMPAFFDRPKRTYTFSSAASISGGFHQTGLPASVAITRAAL